MDTARIITLDQLDALLAAGAVDHFWNVLTPEYFGGELIPGSRWVPLDHVGREVSGRHVGKAARVVVYCSGATCPNSKDAGRKLVALGFTNVSVFEGGLDAWKGDGRGVEVLPKSAAA
jgi:rhodanese-related sulfurtransferase